MEKIRKALDLAGNEATARLALSGRPMPVVVEESAQEFVVDPALLLGNFVMAQQSKSPAAEAMRMLRTQVSQRMASKGWRTLAIIAPRKGDGCTHVGINLAIALASDVRHSALLVDLNLREPGVAERFGLTGLEYGVEDVVHGNHKPEDCLWRPEGFERFLLLPARSSELASVEVPKFRLRELAVDLRSRHPHRYVLFDLPPVLDYDDALAFCPYVDCALLVVGEGATARTDVTRTLELLRNTPVVGVVLNRAFAAGESLS